MRHVSHSVFVFGTHADPFWTAIGKTYLTYISTIVASTLTNLALVGVLELSHDAALVLTASVSVIWSYFALSWGWARHSAEQQLGGYSIVGGSVTSDAGSTSSPALSPVRGSDGTYAFAVDADVEHLGGSSSGAGGEPRRGNSEGYSS